MTRIGPRPAACCSAQRRRRRRPVRRGFNLVELLIALGISSALLAATMVALDASFTAYQRTTETASTHTVARLAMHRMMALVRNGDEFSPGFTFDPHTRIVQSDRIEFFTPNGQFMAIYWDENTEALMVEVGTNDTNPKVLIEGVIPQLDADGDRIPVFTLEYEYGIHLYRATIDLLIEADDNQSVDIEGENTDTIHLVATAMPRRAAY